MIDVVIIGGSAAGLSAALNLGRSLRRTVIFDTGRPCNRFSHASHGFLTRDGISPSELLQHAWKDLERYETVSMEQTKVTAIQPQEDHFRIEAEQGEAITARRVLLATGLRDTLPPIENIEPFWGRSVFHCPYCHGWEIRDQPVAVYGNTEMTLHQAKLVRNLTADLVLCTGEPAAFTDEQRHQLSQQDVRLEETPVVRLEGQGEQMESIVLADGRTLRRAALFIQPALSQHSNLAVALGCRFNEWGLCRSGCKWPHEPPRPLRGWRYDNRRSCRGLCCRSGRNGRGDA